MLKVIGETKQAAVLELQEEPGITVASLTLQLEEVVDENGGDHVKVNIPMALLLGLIKAVKDYKKTHPDWKLVEVDEPDGEHVEIIL